MRGKGYGGFWLTIPKPRIVGAHQAAWMFSYGPIPKGQCVLHRCDVRSCVNPLHLFLGTKTDNNKDRDLKGRQARGERNGKSKITEDLVREIRAMHVPHKFSSRRIARSLGLSFGVCHGVISGANWGHVK